MIFGGEVIRMFTVTGVVAAAHASWYRILPQAQ